MRSIVFFTLMILCATSAYAQPPVVLDSDKPIEITADQLEVLQDQRVAIFSGGVEAVQGNITLNAQRMKVFYKDSSQKSEAVGGMGAVSKLEVEDAVSLTTPEESARAAKGVYDVDKQMITLLGDVVLTRGKNILRGARLDYSFKTQKSLLSSGATPEGESKPTGGRVKGVFVPGQ